jgi:hypothetical protein
MKSLDLLVKKLKFKLDRGNSPEEKLAFYATLMACQLEREGGTAKINKANQIRDALIQNEPSAIFRALRMRESSFRFWESQIAAETLPASLLEYERSFNGASLSSNCMTFFPKASTRYTRF